VAPAIPVAGATLSRTSSITSALSGVSNGVDYLKLAAGFGRGNGRMPRSASESSMQTRNSKRKSDDKPEGQSIEKVSRKTNSAISESSRGDCKAAKKNATQQLLEKKSVVRPKNKSKL